MDSQHFLSLTIFLKIILYSICAKSHVQYITNNKHIYFSMFHFEWREKYLLILQTLFSLSANYACFIGGKWMTASFPLNLALDTASQEETFESASSIRKRMLVSTNVWPRTLSGLFSAEKRVFTLLVSLCFNDFSIEKLKHLKVWWSIDSNLRPVILD